MKKGFDIDSAVGDMVEAAKAVIGKEWPKAKATVEGFAKSKKKRLLMLAEGRIKKDITEAELKEFLEDEKLLLESELLALKVLAKAMIEKAANAAVDKLFALIKAATGIGKNK